MIEESQTDIHAAQQALAQARHVGVPAARPARRAVRRHLLVIGVVTSVAVLASGLISRWGDAQAVWPRALAMGVLWGTVVGAAAALLKARSVRAVPTRPQAIVLIVASALVVGATMGIGPDYVAAYPIGAAATMGVWALGATWLGR